MGGRVASFRVNEPQIIHQTVDDETVIVDLGTGSYYSLRGSAQVIWGALERGLDVSGVVDEVIGRYEEDGVDTAAVVDGFVTQLIDHRLIVALGNPSSDMKLPTDGHISADGDRSSHRDGARQRFEPPVIERYDDLQDLILLDPVHEVSEEEGWPHARSTDEG